MGERIYFHNIDKFDDTDVSKQFSGIQIDRAYPSILSGSMNRDEWLTVCDKIDESVETVNKEMKKSYFIIKVVGGTIGVAFVGAIIALTMDQLPIAIVLFCLFAAILPVAFYISRKLTREGKEAQHNIEHVFEDLNRMKPNVTFHFIDSKVREELCVEIVVNNLFNNPGAGGTATIPAGDGDEEKDPASRLETLENMRAALTVEEYEAKRKQILASV